VNIVPTPFSRWWVVDFWLNSVFTKETSK